MLEKRTKEDLRELQALKIESGHTCGECEYFGDGKYPVVKYFVDGELKSVFVGFSDRPNGEACCFFAHKCDLKNNIVTYENSQSCGSDLKHALSVVVINIILIMAFHVQDIRFLR